MRPVIATAAPASALLVALALSASPARADSPDGVQGPAAIRVSPKAIEVGMFFRGATVHVEGVAPAGYRLALVCLGDEGKVELKRKGKVWAALWMSVGNVSFERVPSLFLASYERRGEAARGGLRYDGIEANVLPAKADDDTRRLFREFVKLKESERLYSASDLRLDSDPSGPVRVAADFWLPANVPPGTYEVRMVGYRPGGSEILASEKLVAERVGLVRLVGETAQQHGLLYGILSVVIAIAAGFLTGVLFASAKKGH